MKFHLGEATLFWNKKIGARYNICTLLLSVTVVCNICWYSVCWTFMECMIMTSCCFEFLLYWLAPLVTNLWHKHKKNICKLCDIIIAIDLCILVKKKVSCTMKVSYLVLSWVSVWGILMCDQPATFGMWLHAVGCIFSSVSYLCDADSSFLQNIGSTTTWCHTPEDHNVST